MSPSPVRIMSDTSRVYVTGVDDAGRSCIVSSDPPTFASAGPMSTASLYTTTTSPPPPRPPSDAMRIDLQLAPGISTWMMVDYPAGAEAPIHHTDSIDFDLVVAGSIEVILDDGPHRLEAGDAVVVTGVDHGLRAGPEGCQLAVLCIGTVPVD